MGDPNTKIQVGFEACGCVSLLVCLPADSYGSTSIRRLMKRGGYLQLMTSGEYHTVDEHGKKPYEYWNWYDKQEHKHGCPHQKAQAATVRQEG